MGVLLAFRKPVGVRGMVWGLNRDRLRELTADPEGEPFFHEAEPAFRVCQHRRGGVGAVGGRSAVLVAWVTGAPRRALTVCWSHGLVRIDVAGAKGATGVIAWQIDAV
ncbi:hypothetical protein GCM10010103_31860 [Streptomyces paradoxus]